MTTYKIVRYYKDNHESKVLYRGMTLEAAKKHCNNPETSSETATLPRSIEHTKKHGPWFDGWTSEK